MLQVRPGYKSYSRVRQVRSGKFKFRIGQISSGLVRIGHVMPG
jgi:hypothetical protein